MDTMRDHDYSSGGFVYNVGLDRTAEPVVSSHFMQQLCMDSKLELYDEAQFAEKSLHIDARVVFHTLIPAMLSACQDFVKERAVAARQRAKDNYRKYGLRDLRDLGPAQYITEVMFDRHYRRGARETCSRELICRKVKQRMESRSPIEMVIPALPFKFSSPLKTRGRLPDLGEVNFILGLYEIVATIELIYKEARPDLSGILARFTVVSDGGRFNHLVDEPDSVVATYQAHVRRWIRRLRLQDRIELIDYRVLLRDRLPAEALREKAAIRARARVEYANTLWPIYNPCDMAATLEAAARADPDPESSNPDGRFFSLLKSLIYTINYKALKQLEDVSESQYRALYRDLSVHIFEPFASTDEKKEHLRRLMLREAWNAAIEYMAEIKSDRELANEPISNCLPDHIRWTIHAKSGQLAISTFTAIGIPVQAWAGAAVFKRAKNDRIKLCTLPVVALEGAGATPVRVSDVDNDLELAQQPLFYIYPDLKFSDADDLFSRIGKQLVRKRVS